MSRIDLNFRLDAKVSLNLHDASVMLDCCRSTAAATLSSAKVYVKHAGGWCLTMLAQKLDALLREGIE
jgi:hypothetical protein